MPTEKELFEELTRIVTEEKQQADEFTDPEYARNEGLTTAVSATRLRKLVEAGILTRRRGYANTGKSAWLYKIVKKEK